MKTRIKSLASILLIAAIGLIPTLGHSQDFPEEKLGWTLSAQTYTFRQYTLAEALDKTVSAGLKSIEAYNGQVIGGGIDGNMSFKMDPANRKKVLQLLKDKNVKLIGYGVVNGNTEEEWKQLFEFASEMGIKLLNTEPKEEFLPLIGQLANKYKIKVGIHNHPKPTPYWSPEIVLAAVAKANSKYVGACADIGHWVRSGLDPIESLKKYEGHLISLHFKDLNEKTPKAHDVHWGTGIGDVERVINELKRQKFKGNLSAEYEYNWENNVTDVTESVKNFRNILNK